MNLNLNGKVAVVTGASKGIGAGIAKALAAEGVKVIVNYATSHGDASQVVTAIENENGQAIAIQADVSKSGDVERLFKEAYAAFGRIDIVINNAGVFKFEPIENITEEEFHRQFNTNVLAPFLTTQQALKYFPESGGNIINISSGASKQPGHSTSLYGATKAAVDTLTEAFAKELGSRNIRVNAVAPGVTESEGVHSLGTIIGTDTENAIISATALGRIGQPEDIATVVVFLVSDAAGWLTGVRIRASGGLF